MGANQHLARSIVPLREQGLALADGTRVMPTDPRRAERGKIQRLAKQHGIERWTTDWTALATGDTVFFDAAPRSCARRSSKGDRRGQARVLRKAGGDDVAEALDLWRWRRTRA